LVAVDADEAMRNYRWEVRDKGQIGGLLFGGFAKCLQTCCKFQSDPERVFAAVLEQDAEVVKWFRPGQRDVRIYYQIGSRQPEYRPDFIVEAATVGKWICETKRETQMQDEEVRAKAAAAAQWCQHATEATGEKWGYLLIPHDQVSLSMTFAGFVAGCRVEAAKGML
jgi:type III restriction enzyme